MKTLYTNAVIHTMEDPNDVHHSMTVEDGIITAFDGDKTGHKRVVDLQGLHVFPALIDAHVHMMETIALSGVGVTLCRIENNRIEPHDLAGIGQMIRAHAATQKPDSLLVYSNHVSATMTEKRLPNRFELDEWTNNQRVWVLNIDGHSSSCSTALLAALNLSKAAPDGILTGHVHDANLSFISDYLAKSITPSLLAGGIADFCNTCAAFGIGTVCALVGNNASKKDTITALIAYLAQRFPLDIRLFPQYKDEKKLQTVLPRMGKKRIGGCLTWELDGSIGSRNAAFARPYKDGTQVPLYYETEVVKNLVDDYAGRGFFMTIHAIGELAIEQLVGVYEQAPGTHRIDHCEFPSPEILPRIYALKPFVTIQPGYSWIDKRYLLGYARFLDDDILQQQVPLKAFEDNGVVLCGSSDAPVQTVDPYLQMRGMREFYVEEQSLSAFEALKTYTVNGGIMLGEKIGLLRPGYEASFFTTDCDLLSIEPNGLENVRAESLYLRGKRFKPLSGGLGTLIRLALSPARIFNKKLL